MTCSGPTATYGSGGSPRLSGPPLRVIPWKPGCWISGLAFVVDWLGARPGARVDGADPVPLPVAFANGFRIFGAGAVEVLLEACFGEPCATGPRFAWSESEDALIPAEEDAAAGLAVPGDRPTPAACVIEAVTTMSAIESVAARIER